MQIDFPIVVGDKIRTLGNWSGKGLPYTVIVSPAGKIAYDALGPREWDEQQYFDALVALNEIPSSNSFSTRVATTLKQFHSMSTVQKIGTVFILLLAIVVLMMLVRVLSRRKSANSH